MDSALEDYRAQEQADVDSEVEMLREQITMLTKQFYQDRQQWLEEKRRLQQATKPSQATPADLQPQARATCTPAQSSNTVNTICSDLSSEGQCDCASQSGLSAREPTSILLSSSSPSSTTTSPMSQIISGCVVIPGISANVSTSEMLSALTELIKQLEESRRQHESSAVRWALERETLQRQVHALIGLTGELPAPVSSSGSGTPRITASAAPSSATVEQFALSETRGECGAEDSLPRSSGPGSQLIGTQSSGDSTAAAQEDGSLLSAAAAAAGDSLTAGGSQRVGRGAAVVAAVVAAGAAAAAEEGEQEEQQQLRERVAELEAMVEELQADRVNLEAQLKVVAADHTAGALRSARRAADDSLPAEVPSVISPLPRNNDHDSDSSRPNSDDKDHVGTTGNNNETVATGFSQTLTQTTNTTTSSTTATAATTHQESHAPPTQLPQQHPAAATNPATNVVVGVAAAAAAGSWGLTLTDCVSVPDLLAAKATLEREVRRYQEECVAVPRAEYAEMSSMAKQMAFLESELQALRCEAEEAVRLRAEAEEELAEMMQDCVAVPQEEYQRLLRLDAEACMRAATASVAATSAAASVAGSCHGGTTSRILSSLMPHAVMAAVGNMEVQIEENEERREWEAEVERWRQRAAALEAERDSLAANVVALKQQKAAINQLAEAAVAEVAAAKVEASVAAEEAAEANMLVNAAVADAADARAEADAAAEEAEVARAAAEAVMAEATAAKAEVAKAKAETAAARAEAEAAAAAAAEAKAEAEAAVTARAEAEARAAAAEAATMEAQEAAAAAAAVPAADVAPDHEGATEVEMLREQLAVAVAAAVSESARLGSRVAELEEEVEALKGLNASLAAESGAVRSALAIGKLQASNSVRATAVAAEEARSAMLTQLAGAQLRLHELEVELSATRRDAEEARAEREDLLLELTAVRDAAVRTTQALADFQAAREAAERSMISAAHPPTSDLTCSPAPQIPMANTSSNDNTAETTVSSMTSASADAATTDGDMDNGPGVGNNRDHDVDDSDNDNGTDSRSEELHVLKTQLESLSQELAAVRQELATAKEMESLLKRDMFRSRRIHGLPQEWLQAAAGSGGGAPSVGASSRGPLSGASSRGQSFGGSQAGSSGRVGSSAGSRVRMGIGEVFAGVVDAEEEGMGKPVGARGGLGGF